MTDDPSSPSKKLARETWSNLCTQDTQESHTRNMASDDSDEDALAVFLMHGARRKSKSQKNESDAHGSSRGYKIGQLWEPIMRCCKNYSARTRRVSATFCAWATSRSLNSFRRWRHSSHDKRHQCEIASRQKSDWRSNITWRPMRPLDFSHVIPSFSDGIEL